MPPAREMAEYESVLPGLADRIVTMTEDAAVHNREMRKRLTDAATGALRRGQWLAAGVAVVAIVATAVGGDGAVTLAISRHLFYILVAVFVWSRLPKWFREWTKPSADRPS